MGRRIENEELRIQRETRVMDKALEDLIRISNVTGKDSTLVQGGGGNTSNQQERGGSVANSGVQ